MISLANKKHIYWYIIYVEKKNKTSAGHELWPPMQNFCKWLCLVLHTLKLKTNIGLVPLHSINPHLPLQTCLPPDLSPPTTVSPTHTASYLASSSLPSIQPWSTGNRKPGVTAPCWGGGSRYSAVIGPRCPLLGERVQTRSLGSLLGDMALIKTQFRDGSSFIEPINPQLSQSDFILLEGNSLRVCESPLTWRVLWVLGCWSLIIWSSLLDLKLSRRAFYFLVFYLFSLRRLVRLSTKVNLNPQNYSMWSYTLLFC